jgi:hypothetical protein
VLFVLFLAFVAPGVVYGMLAITTTALVVIWVGQLRWVRPLAWSIRARRLRVRDHPEIRALLALWRTVGIEAAETASRHAIRAFERE